LKLLVFYLEKFLKVGAVQGTISRRDKTKIESCGWNFDSMYRVYPRGYNRNVSSKIEGSLVSLVSGAYSVYRIEAIEKCGGLFGAIPLYFGYFDDADLCIRLWRLGYQVRYLPVFAGQHKSGKTFSSLSLKHFLNGRNRLATILNLKGKRRVMALSWILYFSSRILLYLVYGLSRNKEYFSRAKNTALILSSGIALSRQSRQIEGEGLEPVIKLGIPEIIKRTFKGGSN
jgi:GT2 family glycosyltransferase